MQSTVVDLDTRVAMVSPTKKIVAIRQVIQVTTEKVYKAGLEQILQRYTKRKDGLTKTLAIVSQ